MPLLDEFARPADILAGDPAGPLGLWLGQVAMIGQEQIQLSRLGEPLAVFATLMDWLRAGRTGVVILNPARAAGLLDGVRLCVATIAERRKLEADLTRPAPPIVVRAADGAIHQDNMAARRIA